MGSHPLNLLLRFVLELTALWAAGRCAYGQLQGPLRWLGALLLPAALATLWGVFAVPEDPSRGGAPVVAVPGWMRLLLELGFFAVGLISLRVSYGETWCFLFGGLLVLHYALAWDRLQWLWSVR